MSKSRKERREAAAKAARTIHPVAVPVAVPEAVEDKLRVAYNHIESVEAENATLHTDYMDLEQKADDRIAALQSRVLRVGGACWSLGVLLGAALSQLPW